MADLNFKQNLSQAIVQRTVLLGRLKMAQAIHMPEGEWAKILSDIEKDPLFQELLSAQSDNKNIISYTRPARSGISGQFYEMQEAQVVGSSSEDPESLLDEKKHLLEKIEKIGQDNFEKFFLFRESGESIENIANQCGISVGEAQDVQNFILDMSVQSEFFHPSALDTNKSVKPTLVGRIVRNSDGVYSISFFSPHMARGQYEINRNALKSWQKKRKLNRQDASRVRKFVGMLELSNLKQGAFWRVMEYLMVLHKEYFDTRDESKMAAVSLRKVARHLQFAPSTISRVMGNKSVLLPWDREVLILELMPGQRRVVLNILDKVLAEPNPPRTDAKLAKKLEDDFGVKVSRRTITACRHVIEESAQKKAA